MKDISLMTKEEFDRYGLNRTKIMLKMKKQSEVCLQKRPTPLQDIILQTAENHLSRCEQIFGISRYYKRLSGKSKNTIKHDFLRTKSIIVRRNPASPDTPTGKPLGWSGTIIDFLMKINNLYFSERWTSII